MEVILAIESAIAGGSLSLIRGGEELGNWIGWNADALVRNSDEESERRRPRSEELLVNIDAMLTACSVSRHDISLVAVSAGPGSFTGIRIGLATALGLKTGLNIPITSVSALEAMCQAAGSPPFDAATIAVPMGRDSVCFQSFDISEAGPRAVGDPRSVAETEFERFANADEGVRVPLIMHAALFEKFSSLPNAFDFGANIAYAVGRTAVLSPGTMTRPLFISKG